MDLFSYVFPAIFLLVVGRFLYGRFKHGSWTGSFLRGRIDRTIGEVTLSSGFVTQTLTVHAMRAQAGEEDFVAMTLVAKALLGASMHPYKLTKGQARELANYLAQAAK